MIGTALDVWGIVAASRSYRTPSEMAAATDLTEPQIRLALAYYSEFPEEVDGAIAENERPLAELQRQYPTIDTVAVGDLPTVRLFLDEHVSARRIATALRERHDVRAADEERELDGWDDERLLALATEQGQIMVTFNVKDFAGSPPNGQQRADRTLAACSSSASTIAGSASSCA